MNSLTGYASATGDGLGSVKSLIRQALRSSGLFYPLRERVYFRNHPEIGGRRRKQIEFYKSILGPAKLVFDVGANIGQRTAVFATLGKRVVAFEPDQRARAQLQARFRFNRNVVIEGVALGAKNDMLPLYCSDTDALSSLSPAHIEMMRDVYFPTDEWRKLQLVRVTNLDSMVQKYGVPGFIKIDVEGFELEVLQGLSTPVSLSFEWHGCRPADNLKRAERVNELSNDYRFNYCVGEDTSFMLPQSVNYRAFVENVVPVLASDPSQWGDVYALL